MQWEPEADGRARKIIRDHSVELSEESERVAKRLRAGAVSADYVDEAAFTIRVRRPPSAWGDLLLAVGVLLLGAAGGVLTVIASSTASTHLKLGWVGPGSVVVACFGFLLGGIGGTIKVVKS